MKRFYVICDEFVDGGHATHELAVQTITAIVLVGACQLPHNIVEADKKLSPESVRRKWKALASTRHPSAG